MQFALPILRHFVATIDKSHVFLANLLLLVMVQPDQSQGKPAELL